MDSLLLLVDQRRAGWLFECRRKRAIFIAIGAANLGDATQVILRLIAITLLDLPKAVIVPRQDMVRIGFERTLIPNLREFVVAELAIGITDQVGHVRVVVVTKLLELIDGRGIVMAIIDRVIGCAVTLFESRIIEERSLVGFLGAMA